MRTAGLAVVLVAVAMIALVDSAVAAAPLLRGYRTADGALTIGHLFAVDSLNPFIGFSDTSRLLYSLLYDSPFSVDEDQSFVPNLATSASTPDDGRTWVYKIRQGVKWHDGTDFTAEDVAFTINYNIRAFWLLWAYEPYVNQILQCPSGQSTGCGGQVTGPSEVTIYFRRPFAPGGSGVLVPILQKQQWEDITPSSAQYSYQNPNPIGTGPYTADPNIYDQWFNGRPIVLHRNPDYHFGAPMVERLVFRHFPDERSMVAALRQGDIDVAMLSAAGAGALRALALPNVELQEGLSVTQYWIDIGITQLNHPGVNIRLNPARFDLAVRQAMAHATNKEYILQQFYRGKGAVGSTLVSPVTDFWHYEPGVEKFDFNLTKANAILDAAGYTVRDPGSGLRRAAAAKTLEVYCSPENLAKGCQTSITIPQGTPLSFSMVTRVEAPEEVEIAQHLDEIWNSIGIDLTIMAVEEIAMTVYVYGGEFDSYIWWWSGDPDPNFILSIQSNLTLSGWSDNFYDNETYNNLYLAQLSALDSNERRQYVHEAQKVHYQGAAFIILVYPYFHYAWWTDEYEGWGDMVAHPGRQIGASWGKQPLFLDLRPRGATNRSPTILSFHGTPEQAEVGQLVDFVVDATDPEGGTLTLSIDYGDGSGSGSRQVPVGPGENASARFTHSYASAGMYLARAQVFDGDLTSPTAEVAVRIDVAEPPSTTVLVEGSEGESGWYVSAVTVSLSAVDDGSGVASTYYRLDGGAWERYLAPFEVIAEGAHALDYYTEDVAGNREAAKSTPVRVDVSPPEITALAPTGTVIRLPVIVYWSGVDGISGLARYEVSLDGGPFQSVGTETRLELLLDDGEHTLRVRAFDVAGNVRESQATFRFDTNVFSLSGPYLGLPTFAIVGSVAAAIVILLRQRMKIRRP